MEPYVTTDRNGDEFSVEFDGVEGIGLWFCLADEWVSISDEETRKFVNWIYRNFNETEV